MKSFIYRSPRTTACTAAAVLALSSAVIVLSARSWGGEARPNSSSSRSRPNLIANQKPVRDILKLTPDQIEKFHAVERKYLQALKDLATPKLTLQERREKRDEITLKINAEVQGFLSPDQYRKLIEVERESGSFRSHK